jgi:hypothetical protein
LLAWAKAPFGIRREPKLKSASTGARSVNPAGGEYHGKSQPGAKFRLGYVTVTVWQNGDLYNSILTKTYKDGEEYKTPTSSVPATFSMAPSCSNGAEQFISEQ